MKNLLFARDRLPANILGFLFGILVMIDSAIGGSVAGTETLPDNTPGEVKIQIRKLFSDDPVDRASAAFFLREADPPPTVAIPFLIVMLDDDTVIEDHPPISPSDEAVTTLAAFGDAAVPPLASALKDGNPRVRRRVAEVLGKIRDARAVGALKDAMNDVDRHVRLMAAWALSEIGNSAVKPLIAVLEDSESPGRADAAWALGKVGNVEAVEALQNLVDVKDPDMKRAVGAALKRLTGMNEGKRRAE